MIRGEKRDQRQKIRRQAERRGTGSAWRIHRRRQAAGAIADNKGAHSVESGCLDAGEGWSDNQIAERFEWRYPPKHGNWLDMAECELGVLATQCLDRRNPDKPSLRR